MKTTLQDLFQDFLVNINKFVKSNSVSIDLDEDTLSDFHDKVDDIIRPLVTY